MSAKVSSPRRVALWRNRDYLLLWSGQAVSSLGTQASQLALPLLVLALTGSPAQAGFVTALRTIPYLFLSLPAGALVDRWNRKRVMILCDLGRAVILGSIPLVGALGYLTVIQLYLVSLLEGTLFVFFNLAETACLPRVVPQEQLPTATAWNEGMENTALLLGPPLGGLLYQIGQMLPFLADAISYVCSALSLCWIRVTFQQERIVRRRKLHREIGEGLHWLWQQPLIRAMALLGGGFNFVFAGQTLLVIVLARQQHAAPLAIGFIFAIAGVGGILGALAGPFFQRRFSFGQVILSACWLYAFLWALYVFGPSLIILAAITTGFFFISPIYDVVQLSYRLALIPDLLQGRVNSAFRLIMYCLMALGQALTGVLLQRFGAVPTVLIFGIGLLLLALGATLNAPIRQAQPLAAVHKEEHRSENL